MRTRHFVEAIILLFLTGWCCFGAAPKQMLLWYWQHSYLTNDNALRSAEQLIDRAAAAGYNGVIFWDSSFSFLSDSFWPTENVQRLKAALQYARKKGLYVVATGAPFGFSNDALQANPNWAESEQVVGSRFKVDSAGRTLVLLNSFPGLENASFEQGKTGWFGLNDPGAELDQTVSHIGHSAGVIRNASGNARFRELIKITPWRQYHVRLFVKTQEFQGLSQIEVLDASGLNRLRPSSPLLNATFKTDGTADWKPLDYTFNSRDSTSAYLYFGVWGGSRGTVWFDDAQVEETALVYLTRRSGTPIKVYDPQNPQRVFREDADFNPIVDARMTSTRGPFSDNYHPPTPVTLPATTQLRPEEIVAIDSYSVFPIPGINDVGMCLTEPAVLHWQQQNAEAIRKVLPPQAGLLMQYDEMRQMNSCGSCRAKHMTAGQLLAWSVQHSTELYGNALPQARLFIWNDMFDPFHNAVDHYYYVEGSLAGSWNGVAPEITVVNWNLGNLHKSLRWFSGLDVNQTIPHKQIIAGYYDSGNGAAAADTELREAAGVPGIKGLLYTTWGNDYSQLEAFADSARAHWATYTASTPQNTAVASASRLLISLGVAAGLAVFVLRLFGLERKP